MCDDNYIKSVSQKHCDECGYEIDECPSSRENEVQRFVYKTLLHRLKHQQLPAKEAVFRPLAWTKK
jgi:hypothetical protein